MIGRPAINSLLLFNWLVFLASSGLLVYLGLKAKRLVHGGSEAGFLVAGRSLGPVIGAATVVATGYSGWAFIGSPGAAYRFGTVELVANIMFAPAMVISLALFANYLRRRAAELNTLTIPEYIAAQHGTGVPSRLIQGLVAALTIVLLLVFLTGQLKALGLMASGLLGISMEASIYLLVLIIIAYTMIGGMGAIAWADGVMVIGMTMGAVLLIGTIFSKISLPDLLSQLEAVDAESVNPQAGQPYGESKLSPFLLFPYAFLFTLCLPYMANRILSFREDIGIHNVVVVVALLTCVLSTVPIAGLYARSQLILLEDPDQAVGVMIDQLINPYLGALISVAVLFAIKSTANSLLHAISSAASHDLRKALLPEVELSAERTLLINRSAVVMSGLCAVVAVLYAPPFMLVWLGILGTGTLLASLAAPMLIPIVWQGNSYGAVAAILTGFTVTGLLMLYLKVGWVEAPLIGCVLSALAYWLVSLATRSMQHTGIGK